MDYPIAARLTQVKHIPGGARDPISIVTTWAPVARRTWRKHSGRRHGTCTCARPQTQPQAHAKKQAHAHAR
eukprot:8347376-Alexandrium_andersonii.AAC.1